MNELNFVKKQLLKLTLKTFVTIEGKSWQ